MGFVYIVLHLILLLLLAPLVEGTIRKTKAFWQNREGPGLLQPYYNLIKYLKKDSVISDNASWLYWSAPYLTFASIAAAALLIPSVSPDMTISFAGDIILLCYLFAFARFYMALAGLDTGSAFGGMGSSREMFISAMVEPVMFLALFSIALKVNSTDLSVIAGATASIGLGLMNPSHILAMIAMFIVSLAETGRIPIDNPDTHLELTMVHEGMLLEYSGKPLALMQYSAMLKQMLILTLLGNVFLPWGGLPSIDYIGLLSGSLIYIVKIFILALITATVEIANNKLRIFRVPGLLMTAFFLAGLAVVVQLLLKG